MDYGCLDLLICKNVEILDITFGCMIATLFALACGFLFVLENVYPVFRYMYTKYILHV